MDADSSASAALHELMQQDVEAFCTESRALGVKLRKLQYTSVTLEGEWPFSSAICFLPKA